MREKFKHRPCNNESPDALYRDRPTRSSVETPVMGVERRGSLISANEIKQLFKIRMI
jgi:hypothetical protein